MSDNSVFARYVTSTAFSLSLSGSMIAELDHLMQCQWYGRFIMHDRRDFAMAFRSLQRRGLADRDERSNVHITEAGRKVHELCVLAGLVDALPVEAAS